MTLKEGIAEIRDIKSGVTVIASKQEHFSPMHGDFIATQYTLTVLPGLDGSECTQLYGPSVEDVVRQMKERIHPIVNPSTPNEE